MAQLATRTPWLELVAAFKGSAGWPVDDPRRSIFGVSTPTQTSLSVVLQSSPGQVSQPPPKIALKVNPDGSTEINQPLAEDFPVPEWFEVLPAGETLQPNDGRPPISNRNAQAVVDRFNEDIVIGDGGRTRAVLDIEHNTMKWSLGELDTEARGFVHELRLSESGAIEARPRYTTLGRAEMARGARSSFSSVVAIEYEMAADGDPDFDKPGTISKFLGGGFTNSPALDVPAFSREQGRQPAPQSQKDESMKLTDEIRAKYGVGADVNASDFAEAVLAHAKVAAPPVNISDGDPKVIESLTAQVAKLASADKANSSLIEALEADKKTREVESVDLALASAVADGKLTPSESEDYKELGLAKGSKWLRERLAAKPVSSLTVANDRAPAPSPSDKTAKYEAEANDLDLRRAMAKHGFIKEEYVAMKKAEDAQRERDELLAGVGG